MNALSIRLPDDLDVALSREAQLEAKSRSEVARKAITEYLQRLEKARFMAKLTAEAKLAYGDAKIFEESLAIAEGTVDSGLDAIIEAERKAGIDPGEKWWR